MRRLRESSRDRIRIRCVPHQVRNYWQRADLVDNFGVVSRAVFRRIRLRRGPLYVHLLMARDIFDPWAAVTLRRIELNHWVLARQWESDFAISLVGGGRKHRSQ